MNKFSFFLLFVLTNLSSVKILQLKTGITIDEHPNIYVDRDNAFYITTNNRIYPCVIELEDGKIVSHSYQSPRSTAFVNWKMRNGKQLTVDDEQLTVDN